MGKVAVAPEHVRAAVAALCARTEAVEAERDALALRLRALQRELDRLTERLRVTVRERNAALGAARFLHTMYDGAVERARRGDGAPEPGAGEPGAQHSRPASSNRKRHRAASDDVVYVE